MIRPILLKKNPFDPKIAIKSINQNLDKSAAKIQDDFALTTKTWSSAASFKIKKGRLTRVIFTSDKRYFYVSGGTKVRYATMTGNFKSKTTPGRFASRGGRGGVMFISKKRPRPGIKARKFDEKEVKRSRKWLGKEFKLKVG